MSTKSFGLVIVLSMMVCGIGGGLFWYQQSYDYQEANDIQKETKALKVTASFYPLYFVSQAVAGDKASVTNVVPPGAEAHEYAPTPQDMVRLSESDVVVLHSPFFEGWAQSVIKNKSERTTIVAVGEGLSDLHPTETTHEDGHHDEHEGESGHGHDPHMWLSPNRMQVVAELVANTLAEKDPENAAYYKANRDSLKARFAKLDADYARALSSCKKKEIVVSHQAYGYLASDFGLKQVPIAGLSPEEEPSAVQLAEVARFAKEHQATHIFFETLVSPALAETVAREVGAQVLVLDPVEGLTEEAAAQGADYFSLMYANLDNLKIALVCQ